MGVYIECIEIPKDGHLDIRIHADGLANVLTGEPPYYKRLEAASVMEPTGGLISRAELFNQLAEIKSPPEANEYKAEVYTVIQNMEVKA